MKHVLLCPLFHQARVMGFVLIKNEISFILEIYFKGTPKLIHFYPKFHLVTPNENLPQNYFFFTPKLIIFYPKINYFTPT